MDRVKQARQIDAILDGKMTVPEAHPDVQSWFELTVYGLALHIAEKGTPEERRRAAEIVKSEHPEWQDDVLPLARKLVNSITDS